MSRSDAAPMQGHAGGSPPDAIEDDLFASAFRHAAIGMALVATDGRFMEVNESFGNIVGRSLEELQGMTYQEITHPDDVAMDEAQADAVARGALDTYTMNKRYIRPDGEVRWVRLTVSPCRRPDGSTAHFISQVQDIQALMDAERERDRLLQVQANARARQTLTEMRDRLLHRTAHELRTPLTPLKMDLQLLLDRPDLDPFVAKVVERLERNINRFVDLIHTIIDASRLELEAAALHRVETALDPLLQAAISEARLLAEQRSVQVEVREALPVKAEVDPERAREAFQRVLAHAIRLGRPGSAINVALRPDESGREALLAVHVQESALAPDVLLGGFEAFGNLDANGVLYDGIGLDLVIAKALIEAHGGRAWAEPDQRPDGVHLKVALPLTGPGLAGGLPSPPGGPAPHP